MLSSFGVVTRSAMAADLVQNPTVNVDWVQFVVKDEKALSDARLIVQDCMGYFAK